MVGNGRHLKGYRRSWR